MVWHKILQKFNIAWTFLEDLQQFIINWKCPSAHPLIRQFWKLIPHICWNIWKERNNKIFRDTDNSVDTVVGITENILRENTLVCKWKKPQSAPLEMDCNWVRTWNIPNDFLRYENSKRMERLNTRWSTPSSSWLKLNFDGATRSGVAAAGGIIRDSLGNLILAYVGNLGSTSSNMVKALELFWGLKLALNINATRLIIEGDSRLIIEATKGVSGISWMISSILKDIWSMIVWLEEFQIQHIYRGKFGGGLPSCGRP
ncbi:uncharacterized protein LOC131861213 [Cryptomeria japonica]|uniref:uncharacterized protein LOC131861213 n=1 Tax=Cryptomeria japonica TaxID=3369 RepID=UPI0027DA9491|nr:uncharacterized protein LOC131861213 [Cryptomeria japonica]